MPIKQKRIRLFDLFQQLAESVNLPTKGNFDMKSRWYKEKWLHLDFNSIYGGYRLDLVHESTGESFFDGADRRSLKEMLAYLEGFLKAKTITK